MPTLHHATLDRIDPATLYRIMVLRTDVFVFEQGIVSEPELDGRDLEPTLHLGRVATAAPARGRGLAGQLLEAVFEAFPAPIEISAQAYLENWYGRYGFRRTGENYLEAGIDHLPMRRSAPVRG
ncbi:acetyltransferase family protein [Rhodococcus opacus]|uniref:Acetyltransferase family protein n=1 Tax=Rhodococcus opacus TaxID=37919 RepID=A0A1B1K250_RHOOP|nr:GNAT family N-acetyltransferase [Rhodococcus opacus]ANS26648.1 acetyltransferase family protein [Rhodococcus opacus]